jgi:glycoprotein-N-acetylgalactosamine 3-beta-galactosyltransferase
MDGGDDVKDLLTHPTTNIAIKKASARARRQLWQNPTKIVFLKTNIRTTTTTNHSVPFCLHCFLLQYHDIHVLHAVIMISIRQRRRRQWMAYWISMVVAVVFLNGIQFSKFLQQIRMNVSDEAEYDWQSLDETTRLAKKVKKYVYSTPLWKQNSEHDPYYIKNNPPPFTMMVPQKNSNWPLLNVCNSTGMGTVTSIEGYMGGLGLKQIQVLERNSLYFETPTPEPRPQKRILCVVYTVSTRHDRVRAIAETYGPRCDGFLAASNLTDPSIGAWDVGFSNESYGNMWAKVRHIWKFVYDNFLEEFDYFFIAGDDTFLIPENLRHMVTMQTWRKLDDRADMVEDDKIPLLLGYAGPDPRFRGALYCMGGAGYVLNRAALQQFNQRLKDCMVDRETSEEDRLVSVCFRRMNVNCTDTREPLEKGAPRFHILNAQFHASVSVCLVCLLFVCFSFNSWLSWSTLTCLVHQWNFPAPTPGSPRILKQLHGIREPDGLGQIPRSTISFHLKHPWKLRKSFNDTELKLYEDFADEGMRRYYASIYKLCQKDRI